MTKLDISKGHRCVFKKDGVCCHKKANRVHSIYSQTGMLKNDKYYCKNCLFYTRTIPDNFDENFDLFRFNVIVYFQFKKNKKYRRPYLDKNGKELKDKDIILLHDDQYKVIFFDEVSTFFELIITENHKDFGRNYKIPITKNLIRNSAEIVGSCEVKE